MNRIIELKVFYPNDSIEVYMLGSGGVKEIQNISGVAGCAYAITYKDDGKIFIRNAVTRSVLE